ncbi:MAG: M16 family metallopeptidase [Bacteroidia bacterium]
MAKKRKGTAEQTAQTYQKINLIELPNGIRVLHLYIPYTRAAHCAYVFDAGSRDDPDDREGLAHFLEHMIFKGTERRKTFHVLNYLESVGGEINAYTTKEKTCIYASLAAEHAERAVDLLTDIAFHATFPEKEIVKERQVISEEIDLYRDAPDEAIFEDFDVQLFPDHPLGAPILGSKDSISNIGQDDLNQYVGSRFTQGKVMFAIAGNVTEKQMTRLVDKYIRPQELPSGSLVRNKPGLYKPSIIESTIPGQQAHELMGGRAFHMRHEQYHAFLLLINMLGGPAMNSRLNLNIREKFGLTYSINSFYAPYLDSGIWGVYYACEQKNLKRVRRLVDKELNRLVDKPLGSLQLHQVKKQLIGQLILSHENPLNQLLSASKDLLDFGVFQNFHDQLGKLEQVTVAQIQEAARLIFDQDIRSRNTYLPD